MTVAYENQFDLKHYTKADSNDIELALIGIEIMEEIQQMAKQQNVHFSLDADDGFGCIVKGNNFYLELGLKSLAAVYLENCHSGNELRMKVTDKGFLLRALYVEFPDDIVSLLCKKQIIMIAHTFIGSASKVSSSLMTGTCIFFGSIKTFCLHFRIVGGRY